MEDKKKKLQLSKERMRAFSKAFKNREEARKRTRLKKDAEKANVSVKYKSK